MRVRRIALLACVLACGSASARADEPLPGDTRATAVLVRPGESAAIPTATAGREDGDADGGHSVWFRVEAPDGSAWALDTAGTDFDAVMAWGGPVQLPDRPGPIELGFARVAATLGGGTVSGLWAFHGPQFPLFVRVEGVEDDDVGTARLTVRGTPAPEDAWAHPVELDLAGRAVATASRALATADLEPGEPGGAGEQQSVWFATTAPADGRLALDACGRPGLSTSVTDGVVRVLDDRPLGQATVLGAGPIRPAGASCAPVEVDVHAGQRLRVQVTSHPDYPRSDDRSVLLRGRMVGTPPAVDVVPFPLDCAAGVCTARVEVTPAPGAPVAAVECRLDRAAWVPCLRGADGSLRTSAFSDDPSSAVREQVASVRATDVAGRRAVARDAFLFGVPAVALPGGPLLPPAPVSTPSPAPAPAQVPDPRPLALPTGRFRLVRGGTRVVSLVARRVPKGARVTVGCFGDDCPGMRPTARRMFARRFGDVQLAGPLLRRATLRPGTRLYVTVEAHDRVTVSLAWRTRAGRLPRRTGG